MRFEASAETAAGRCWPSSASASAARWRSSWRASTAGGTSCSRAPGAEAGTGHLRIVPDRWQERRDPRLRLADWRADLEAARALPGVSVATPRARAEVLLAMGTRVVPVEMVGVAPETEPRAFRFVRKLAAGRYLAPGEHGTVVIGRAVADRLERGSRRRDPREHSRSGRADRERDVPRGRHRSERQRRDRRRHLSGLARGRGGADRHRRRGRDHDPARRLARRRRRPGRARSAAAGGRQGPDLGRDQPGVQRPSRSGQGHVPVGERNHPAHRVSGRGQRAARGGTRAPARIRGAVGAGNERQSHGATGAPGRCRSRARRRGARPGARTAGPLALLAHRPRSAPLDRRRVHVSGRHLRPDHLRQILEPGSPRTYWRWRWARRCWRRYTRPGSPPAPIRRRRCRVAQ